MLTKPNTLVFAPPMCFNEDRRFKLCKHMLVLPHTKKLCSVFSSIANVKYQDKHLAFQCKCDKYPIKCPMASTFSQNQLILSEGINI